MKHLVILGIVLSAFHVSQSTPDFCLLKPDPGNGIKFRHVVYYDPARDLCSPLYYSGEGGNANRFDNDRECIRNCSARAEEIYPLDATKACYFKKQVGECIGNYLRFYYDAAHDKCKKFLYTGCLGNGNRFFDYDSCNATCAGIHEDSDEEEEEESDTPVAIICGVLIGIIVAGIILTVVLLTVKSKKTKKSKKKGAGKSSEPQVESPLQERAIEMA